MSTRGFLDHLLGQARQSLQGAGITEQNAAGGSNMSGLGKGLLAGGALGLLLGNRSMRRVARVGGLGALGVLSYRAYNSWKQQAADGQGTAQSLAVTPEMATGDEDEARAVLSALIAAAKADGHIDERERALITEGMQQISNAEGVSQWLDQELAKPLDPAGVAALAHTPERAAEIYLASRMVIDEPNFMEKSYLDELSRQLKLDPELRAQLDQQADPQE